MEVSIADIEDMLGESVTASLSIVEYPGFKIRFFVGQDADAIVYFDRRTIGFLKKVPDGVASEPYVSTAGFTFRDWVVFDTVDMAITHIKLHRGIQRGKNA